MEARYMTDLEWRICHAVNIYLYRNGKDGEAPILVHIPPSKKKNMRSVLNVIQERVKFPVGFAAYLYKMDGKRVKHPCELEMYNNYVVASNYDKYFKCAQYGRKRSPLLVLNRESKHIRVLRQQNQNYYEWTLKKKAVGEERPQFIFPTFYTNENIRAQDLPVGQMGNYVPPGGTMPEGFCPPHMTGERITAPQQGYQQPPQHQQQGQPQAGGYPPQQQQQQQQQQQGYQNQFQGNSPRQQQYSCFIQTDPSAQKAIQALQEYPKSFQDNGISTADHNFSTHTWTKHTQYRNKNKDRKPKLRDSDLLNFNVQQSEGEENNNKDHQYEDYASDNSVASVAESVLDTDCLGGKYQDLLKQYKRKLKKQALLELHHSYSSMQLLGRSSRSRYRPFIKSNRTCLRPILTNNMNNNMGGFLLNNKSSYLLEADVDDEQIIVLPPPPIEFRDGIIPRRGTFYSFNQQKI